MNPAVVELELRFDRQENSRFYPRILVKSRKIFVGWSTWPAWLHLSKELVLRNFPGTSSESLLERMIELSLYTEENLR